MKRLLIATTLAAASIAYGQVTLTGTFDADYTTKGFESGDGDLNALSLVVSYDDEGFEGAITLAKDVEVGKARNTADAGDAWTLKSFGLADFNVYAQTAFGKFTSRQFRRDYK